MPTNSTSEPTKDELKAAKKLLKAQEKMQKENVKARERIAKAALEVEREAGRVRMSGNERREQLINVARHLFAEKGYEAVSVEEIAQFALVSKPVIYEHFGSKEGLYAVILDRETRELLRTVISNMESGHPREMLEQAVYAFFTYIDEHPDGYRVLIKDAPAAQGAGAYSGLVNDIVDKCEQVLGNAFDKYGLPRKSAGIYARTLVGSVALSGQWWQEERHVSKDEIVAQVVNFVWNGLTDLQAKPTLKLQKSI
ncbi:MAG: TetR/AcrR family transcriptional regulator [Candidatus Nanopelagicales bacterium]